MTRSTSQTVAACRRCGSPDPGPSEDPGSRGPLCWPCVYRTGLAVLHPELLTYAELSEIHKEHGEVVEVRRVPDSEPMAFEWHWLTD